MLFIKSTSSLLLLTLLALTSSMCMSMTGVDASKLLAKAFLYKKGMYANPYGPSTDPMVASINQLSQTPCSCDCCQTSQVPGEDNTLKCVAG